MGYASLASWSLQPEALAWQGLAVAAAGSVSIIPFTWLFLLPVNSTLLTETDSEQEQTGMSENELKMTVRKWGNINGYRCVLPLVANLIGLWMVLP